MNVATFGLTRIGLNQTGPSGTAFQIDSIDSPVNYTSRAYIRISPTYNVNNDFTWTKGTHTVTAGVNMRFVRNGYTNYANAWPTYAYSRNNLTGLGSDFLAATQSYLTANGMNSSVANTQALQRAGGDLLGLISTGSINYSYTQTGNATPIGVPRVRDFATNEYAGYVADSWRIKPGLTLTAGLRYENVTPPWETNGLEVAPTFSLQDFWGQRLAGAAAGIPSFQLANAEETVWPDLDRRTMGHRLVCPAKYQLRPSSCHRLQSRQWAGRRDSRQRRRISRRGHHRLRSFWKRYGGAVRQPESVRSDGE